jgi:cobalt-zinc-cadmium efflux system outer membrane protein
MHNITAALAVAFYATAAGAQTTGAPAIRGDSVVLLTRNAAIAAALTNNPQLEVGREQTAQARARRVSAVAIPDPIIAYSLDNQPGFLDFGAAGEKNASLTFAIPFPDKFRLKNSIGVADIKSFQAGYSALRQQIAAQTSRSYDSLLVAVKHRDDFRLTRDLSADFLKKTQARFDAGTVPRLDVIRAKVALAQAENDLIASERDVSVAIDAIDRLMGRPVGAPVMPADSLSVPGALPALDILMGAAQRDRPELAQVASEQAGARATTNLSKEYWMPDFALGVQKDYGPQGTPALFTAGFILPLPVFHMSHVRGEIAENVHRERELSATQRDLQAQVAQDVRAAYASASTALRQAVYLRDELLPAAREAYRVATVSYSLGGSSALDVLDAQRSLIDAQTQYADALAAANSSRADLALAVGRLPDTLP